MTFIKELISKVHHIPVLNHLKTTKVRILNSALILKSQFLSTFQHRSHLIAVLELDVEPAGLNHPALLSYRPFQFPDRIFRRQRCFLFSFRLPDLSPHLGAISRAYPSSSHLWFAAIDLFGVTYLSPALHSSLTASLKYKSSFFKFFFPPSPAFTLCAALFSRLCTAERFHPDLG